jgi:hypothetical protein
MASARSWSSSTRLQHLGCALDANAIAHFWIGLHKRCEGCGRDRLARESAKASSCAGTEDSDTRPWHTAFVDGCFSGKAF